MAWQTFCALFQGAELGIPYTEVMAYAGNNDHPEPEQTFRFVRFCQNEYAKRKRETKDDLNKHAFKDK